MADRETNSQSNQEVITQDGIEFRRVIAHLPAFYRTDTNTRFLSSTILEGLLLSKPLILHVKLELSLIIVLQLVIMQS